MSAREYCPSSSTDTSFNAPSDAFSSMSCSAIPLDVEIVPENAGGVLVTMLSLSLVLPQPDRIAIKPLVIRSVLKIFLYPELCLSSGRISVCYTCHG